MAPSRIAVHSHSNPRLRHGNVSDLGQCRNAAMHTCSDAHKTHMQCTCCKRQGPQGPTRVAAIAKSVRLVVILSPNIPTEQAIRRVRCMSGSRSMTWRIQDTYGIFKGGTKGWHWYSVLFDRVDNFLTQDNLHHTLTLLVSCLTQTKHRKEQGLHIKNAQLSLSCVILRPRSNGKLDHNKNQKTSKNHLQPPAQQSSEALFQRRWGGLFDGLFVWYKKKFKQVTNKCHAYPFELARQDTSNKAHRSPAEQSTT